ncbi:hypothetical protein AQUCO_01400442v1 [Aquilegia coerulea]|uniref:F-box domain-containing protein n=1 Tax=Aquilegia coerulea TaxID=218851 RepID=A0A2G5DWE8_AQUCA|nr:hypothetical protein AQUCO_01400442v1 [Aquilegia coerulea]
MNFSNSLPFSDDLIVQIFIRLPIKPLFRFKCVCKQWQALICNHPSIVLRNTTGFYIMVNSTKALQPGNIKFINVHPSGFIIGSSSSDQLVIDMNLNFIQQSVVIVDSNKGFLLLQKKKMSTSLDDDDDKEQPTQYFVCNPLSKQLISLPKPKYRYDREKASFFCYKDDSVDQHDHIEFIVTCYNGSVREIYSSKTRLWIEVEPGLRRDSRGIFFNERVYWLDRWCNSSLLCLVQGDGIRKIKFPCSKQSTYYEQLIGVSGESLYFADSNRSCFMVWRLVNGVHWCMKHHITFKRVIYPEADWITKKHSFIPLAFHPLNYQLVLVFMNSRLVIYRMDEQRIELINELQDQIFPSIHNLPHNKLFPDIRNMLLFPFSLAAWSTCTPRIKDT